VGLLAEADERLDYSRAAFAVNKIVDPTANLQTTELTIARLVDAARQMAGPNPTDAYKLAAVRKTIYDSGPWNYNSAFAYDRADPLGQILKNRLLSTYVQTRKGNCVSMPFLFLIVADRMGLNVHLGTAPLHFFVRYTDPQGVDHNLEATSGGHEARTDWYRKNLPMTDRALESGIYMRTLSKRESIAEMANVVLDFLLEQRRYQEAVEVADAILAVNPREPYTMVKKASAIGGILQGDFIEKYPIPALIPPALRVRYQALAQENERLFKAAEALGWEPTE
jgi:regulator of sirC expression with transglutaminase-like and TPR domain